MKRQKKGKTVTVVYAGKRENGKGGLVQCFMFGKRELFWKHIRAHCIGHLYEAERHGKDGFRMSRRPIWRGEAEGLDKALVHKWEAETAALVNQRKAESAELRASRSGKLEEVARQLAPIVRGIGYVHTRAVITALVDMAEKYGKGRG